MASQNSSKALPSSSSVFSVNDLEDDDFQVCPAMNKMKSIQEHKVEDFVCMVCQTNLTHMNLEERSIHVNSCIDTQSAEPSNTFILDCPLCFKHFPSPELRSSHIKKCGRSRGLSTQSIINAIQLQEKHALERRALGLPLNTKTKSAKSKNPVVRNMLLPPKSVMQSDINLAKALSLSLKEVDTQSTFPVLNIRETATTPILLPPLEHHNPGRIPPKKTEISPPPTLLLRSDEERNKILMENVNSIIDPTNKQTKLIDNTTEQHVHTGEIKQSHLWSLSCKAGETGSYYVQQLSNWVKPSEVEVGSKLCSLSQVPGHQIFTQLPLDYTFSSSQDAGTSEGVDSSSPNQPSSLIGCLRSLIGSAWMSDVAIHTASGIVIPAHKLILALRCPELKTIWGESSANDKNILDWSSFSFEATLHFLNFIYTGLTEWKEDIVNELFQLADKYKVQDLLNILKSDSETLQIITTEIANEESDNKESDEDISICNEEVKGISAQIQCDLPNPEDVSNISEVINDFSMKSPANPKNEISITEEMHNVRNINPDIEDLTQSSVSNSSDLVLIQEKLVDQIESTSNISRDNDEADATEWDKTSPKRISSTNLCFNHESQSVYPESRENACISFSDIFNQGKTEIDFAADSTLNKSTEEFNVSDNSNASVTIFEEDMDEESNESCKTIPLTSTSRKPLEDSTFDEHLSMTLTSSNFLDSTLPLGGAVKSYDKSNNEELIHEIQCPIQNSQMFTYKNSGAHNLNSISHSSSYEVSINKFFPLNSDKFPKRNKSIVNCNKVPGSCEILLSDSEENFKECSSPKSYISEHIEINTEPDENYTDVESNDKEEIHPTKLVLTDSEDDIESSQLITKFSSTTEYILDNTAESNRNYDAELVDVEIDHFQKLNSPNSEVRCKNSIPQEIEIVDDDSSSRSDGEGLLPLGERLKRLNSKNLTSPTKNPVQSLESSWSFENRKSLQDFEAPSKQFKSIKSVARSSKIDVQKCVLKPKIPLRNDCTSKLQDSTTTTPTTFKPQYKFSDSPITPLPDFKNMLTPEIKESLKRIGVKALPRKKAVAVLSHVYEETHPFYDVSTGELQEKKNSELPSSESTKTSQKKRKRSKDSSQKLPQKVIKSTITQNKDMPEQNYLNSSMESNKSGNNYDLDFSSEHSDCSQPVSKSTEDIKNYIMSKGELYKRILSYVPLNLVDFQQELKENGVKISINNLMNYLDKQCVTFMRPRKEEYKKKQQARTQRFRKRMIAKLSQQPGSSKPT